MISASVHILAVLKRCSLKRRVVDAQLRRRIERAIALRRSGNHHAAAPVEDEVTAHLERQSQLGREADEAITALHRVLLQEERTNRKQPDAARKVQKAGGTKDKLVTYFVDTSQHPTPSARHARRGVAVACSALVPLFLGLILASGYTASLATNYRYVKPPVQAGLVLPSYLGKRPSR